MTLLRLLLLRHRLRTATRLFRQAREHRAIALDLDQAARGILSNAECRYGPATTSRVAAEIGRQA